MLINCQHRNLDNRLKKLAALKLLYQSSRLVCYSKITEKKNDLKTLRLSKVKLRSIKIAPEHILKLPEKKTKNNIMTYIRV